MGSSLAVGHLDLPDGLDQPWTWNARVFPLGWSMMYADEDNEPEIVFERPDTNHQEYITEDF